VKLFYFYFLGVRQSVLNLICTFLEKYNTADGISYLS